MVELARFKVTKRIQVQWKFIQLQRIFSSCSTIRSPVLPSHFSGMAPFFHSLIKAQVRVQVRVINVAVNNNIDCDGFLSGDSDFVIEYIATDNTLGLSNNNPVLFGFLGDFN